jgi:hypothetical protein
MKILTISILVFYQFQLFSQRSCGTVENLNLLKNENSETETNQNLLENRIQQIINVQIETSQRTIYRIPVVVHVVYNNDNENISDAQVQSQIDVLNEDYRKLNADINLVPSIYSSLAVDCEIEFCLATRTPENLTSNGITRTQTSATNFGIGNAVKQTSTGGINAWNTNKYLNIWVCDLTDPVLGFATLPGTSSALFDGVVIDYKSFGRIGNLSNSYNKGRTCTHEVGHWFNLIHIWGDDENSGDNCAGTDNVNDTPNQAGPRFGCPTFPQASCGNNGDMSMNYMDYTNDACMYMFTTGQKNRMIATILSARSGILTSNGCEVLPGPLACDTLNNIITSDGLTAYFADEFNSNATGFLTGTNSRDDLSFADKFNFNSGKQVNGALYDFAYAKTNNAGIVLARVWDTTGPNASPGNVIAQKSVSLLEIENDINNFQLTQVDFDNPPYINSPFYVGFTMVNAAGDSIAIYTNQADSVNTNTAWLQNTDSDWFTFENQMTYEIKLSIAVKPIICNPVGIEDILKKPESKVFPNPTPGPINIEILDFQTPTSWIAFNMSGVICGIGVINSSQTSIDISNWSAGIYLFQLNQGGKYFTHKVQLIK